MDKEIWIITPINGWIIVMPIICGICLILAGLNAVLDFIESNFTLIMVLISVLTIGLLIIQTILNKNWKFFILGIIAASQLLLFVYLGFKRISVMPLNGFAMIWTLILFALWVTYSSFNIYCVFGSLGAIQLYCRMKNKPFYSISTYLFFEPFVCVAGWTINLMVFVLPFSLSIILLIAEYFVFMLILKYHE